MLNGARLQCERTNDWLAGQARVLDRKPGRRGKGQFRFRCGFMFNAEGVTRSERGERCPSACETHGLRAENKKGLLFTIRIFGRF